MSGVSGVLVANSLLRIAFREDAPVTPMRLQHLLYVACALYGRTTGRPLTAERFRPWRTGPVLEIVHYKFRNWAHPIDSYCPSAGTPDGGRFARGTRTHATDLPHPEDRFADETARTIARTYADRTEALAAALGVERYVDGQVTLHRRGDGYGMSVTDGDPHGMVCDIAFDPATGWDTDGLTFEDGAHVVTNGTDTQGALRALPPVCDWLEGRADTVSVWTVQPVGHLKGADDDEDDWTDADDLTVLCADRGQIPDWERLIDSPDTRRDVYHMLQSERLEAWPDSDDKGVVVGRRLADGGMETVRRIPADRLSID